MDIRDYLLSIIAASLLCALVNGLLSKGSGAAAVVRMISGIYLAITVISPLWNMRIEDFRAYTDRITTQAERLTQDGENMAQDAMASIIIARTEAYILDKAASLGVDLEVEAVLCDTPPQVPEKILLKGTVSPYYKNMLTQWIADTFGVSGEALIWTG